ncbi:MAG: hypothetical protein HF314_12855 [Ignavibacteria bacterium]|nr:hypothetical protein [Ignavibacteria bacterium]MCU7503964.1 hypothetical protein [Ignavibacteria bacterium]MCU7515815.1 hypothetical protein [Ignavibacteria bacterium]
MSIGVHGLLLAVFLFIRASLPYTPPTEYVEVGFGTPGGSGGGGNGETQVVPDDPQAGPLPGQRAPQDVVVRETKKGEDIPKVENQKIKPPSEDHITSKNEKSNNETRLAGKGSASKDAYRTGNGSPAAGIGNNPLGSGIGNGFGRGSGNGNGSGDADGDGYDIFWGGKGNRKIYSYTLPKYPDGVSKEIDLKLKFTILPDGTVGTIIPLMKADTRLENSAISSLRRWRFAPLPPGQKQLEQTAVIVFPYRLR